MTTLLSRVPTMPFPHSGNPAAHRKATKKSSFLSLRKEKKIPEEPLPLNTHVSPLANDSSTSPSSFQHFDFEEISRPVPSRPMPLGGHRSRSSNKSVGSIADDATNKGKSRGKQKERQDSRMLEPPRDSRAHESTYEFPTTEDAISWIEPEAWARPRSSTGPSSRREAEHIPFLARPVKYPFRDSGSSSLSQFDPLPQTPMDDMSFRDSVFHLPVMVAAPVSGVEAMDALVDGMNGYGGEDSLYQSSRFKFSKSGHHPLYHPPLPTPPPGVTLSGGLSRSPNRRSSSSDDDSGPSQTAKLSQKSRKHRCGSSRTPSNVTLTKADLESRASEESSGSHSDSSVHVEPAPPVTSQKAVIPSISEIIRTHAPLAQQARTKPSLSRPTMVHTDGLPSLARSLSIPALGVAPTDEENDLVSRSSVDTIAEEVRLTVRGHLRHSVVSPPPLRAPPSYSHISISGGHDGGRNFSSPVPDSRRGSSIYSYSTSSDQAPPPALDLSVLTKTNLHSPSQNIAQYLRSSRLTSLLKLTRSPHASRDSPLTVSFSDLGSPTGVPLVVFLGLGCVRHLTGLYDEMAECLGVRLITVDRWGLGRTGTPRNKSARGIPEWASVIEEVLDRLYIDQCSVMAHSAGAPYALAFANKFPERIRGDVCLLAPWVGGGEGGYKWLKYVPNGILKTAQAAEWKVQAWMLGKPPSLAYEGIGFDVRNAAQSPYLPQPMSPCTPTSPTSFNHDAPAHLSALEMEPRKSISSGVFSDYDDLRDFDGRFESKSTLGRRSSGSQQSHTTSQNKQRSQPVFSRKPSKGFLGRLKGGMGVSQAQLPADDRSPNSGSGKRLKALRSMGSLKGRSVSGSTKKPPRPPSLPQTPIVEAGLGFDGLDWDSTARGKSQSPRPNITTQLQNGKLVSPDHSIESLPDPSRAGGRRSVSFGPNQASPLPMPRLTTTSSQNSQADSETTYQAALGNALIAASHSESSKGTHADLLQILNHDRQPWGFSYSAYPHTVRVWHGDRDERIPENAVRWMENTMGPGKCRVKIVQGADHALMFKSAVVVEVLEYISEFWRYD